MTTRNPHSLSRVALAAAQAQIKLRQHPETGVWEVYTFQDPANLIFRWYKISNGYADWYKAVFNAPVVPYVAETAPPTVSATSESTPTKETNHDHSTP